MAGRRHTRSTNVNGITPDFNEWRYGRALSRRQPLRRFRELLGVAELQTQIFQNLDQRSIVAFRGGTDSRARRLVARPGCRNFRDLDMIPVGRNTLLMPNADPFGGEHIRIQGAAAPCRNDGSVPVDSGPIPMQRCAGHLYLRAPQRPTHLADHWICKPCADHTFQQYDHTRYPPWFYGFCHTHSHMAGTLCIAQCQCATTFSPGGGCWLCSDCRRQLGEVNARAMTHEAQRSLQPRNSDRALTDIRRYVRHGSRNRNRCPMPCNRSWRRIENSYPRLIPTVIHNLATMYRRCLFCRLECNTTDTNGWV